MLRNSVAFSAGTVVRMSLGFFTWLAAARLYPASQVGIAASAISAMMLCIEAGLLGVDMALIALFPQHRRSPTALLDTALTLAAIAACASSLAFVALAAIGFHALHVLASNPVDALLFVALTVLGAIWWVIDQAAVSLRRSEQVLVRALVAGAVTLAGVVGLGAAGFATAGAILAAWVAATVAACLIGVRQISRATGGYRFRPRLVRSLRRRLLSVGLPNFALSVADNAPPLLLPIIAAEALSPRFAAYWYSLWMMAFVAYTVAGSFGLHLFAEISDDPFELAQHSRHQLRSGIAVAAVATAGLVALGPFVLAILGPAYASHGSGPLRLVALAAVPMVVWKSYLYTCRAMGRTREGTLAAGIIGVSAVGLAVAAAGPSGLLGMAGAWLTVQVLAALAAAIRLRTLHARAPRPAETSGPLFGTPERATAQ
jgi:O-antigen/teichoic acid export membrane protein